MQILLANTAFLDSLMWNFRERLSALHHKINMILTTIVIPDFNDWLRNKVAQQSEVQKSL